MGQDSSEGSRHGAVAPDETPGYARLLGTFDATMIVAGSMIGSGIFIVSADIARTVGGAGWLLAVWALTAYMTLVGARCYGELATMFPHAGGQYVFLREAFGPLAGFLYGWTLFLVIQTGTIAAVAVAFGKFLGVLMPGLTAPTPLPGLGGSPISWQQIVAIAVIGFLTAANCTGVRTAKHIQNGFTVTKVVALLALLALGLGPGLDPSVIATNLSDAFRGPATGGLLTGLGAAMVGALFSADAWNNVTFTAAEVRNPERSLPRALLFGTALVVTLYFAANVAYLAVLPVAGVEGGATVVERGISHATDDRVATAMVQQVLGASGATLMAVLVMISTFGCVNGLILTGPRLYQAMAEGGLFFRSAVALNQNGVPARALVLQGAWASVLALSGRYGELLDYVIATALLFYALTVIGLLRLRRRVGLGRISGSPHTALPSSRSAPLPIPAARPPSPWLPLSYVVLAVLVCLDLLAVKPHFTWPGFAIVAAGLPVYAIWRKRPSTAAPR